MDYKEKYEQALERARQFSEKPYLEDSAGIVEYIFPELKESEDEKARRSLLAYIKGESKYLDTGKWVAYLEKQGEKEKFIKKELGCIQGYREEAIRRLHELEKQGEQPKKHDVCDNCDQQGSCVSPCPMKLVEKQNTVVIIPKFRVGDVIRPKGSTAEYTIESISGECYHGKGWGLHISCDNDYELVEQKPAEWNEEDEQTFIESVEALEDFGKFELADWLKEHKNKFLSSQSHWKPSDMELEVLRLAAEKDGTCLMGLYEQLKKLREE